jgi:hypothetical protein
VFVAFDIVQMYRMEKQAIFDIVVGTADMMHRGALEERHVHGLSPHEPQDLVDLRRELRDTYVQLYRKILCLTMKIVHEMTGWRVARYGFLDWAGDYKDLQKAEKRVKDHLHSVQQYQINPVVAEPVKWRDKNETKLHAAAKYGHNGDVRRMI